ncbi:uncharacterized protein [Gossypium hirsutum]|uniref:Reverse transcriptase n=1 Tax=Gossypium hirsutum TaxID=3635 RepID=A0ABM2ZT00_GOSHI|nr:uncharacterized protein LOC121215392 [Gossypium hirsutum]
MLLDADRSENLAEIIDTKIHLNLEIEKDESYWEQRARINWLKMGDRNTSFFHKQASQRRRQNRIHKLQGEDGRATEEWKNMEEIARSYFLRLFSTGGQHNFENILTGIRRCISEEDNIKLNARFTKDEIREALSGMGPAKTPGEDGFLALFYQKCWSIVGDDISNFLSPKIKRRLRGLIHKCIDLAQSAFVPGRLISDNVLLAYEILHTLKLKRLGKKGFMALKLDMSKAYDRVEWEFVRGVMEKMGGLSSLMRLAQEENVLKGVKLGNLPSFTWKSIWAARGLLNNGRCWRVGRGDQISMRGDSWIPGIAADRITIQEDNDNVKLVSDLVEPISRSWRTELIRNTFQPDVAEQILKIPLAETEQEDLQVWRGEPTGEFSVRSAYKLLHGSNLDPNDLLLQTETKTFYNKLWKLHIPTKIQMTIWRISWDFIPSFVNLKIKRVVINTLCPRCGSAEENSWHIFIKCPRSMEVWNQLDLSWVLNQSIHNMWGWLTWVFDRGNEEQLQLFCCSLWFIWFSRNHLIYGKRLMSGSEIARKISVYITELAVTKGRNLTLHSSGNLQQIYKRGWTSIHFDAAYERLGFRSASGIIVRNENKEILASQAVIHSNIADPFTAEAYAGLHAIKLGIRLGVNKLTVLGDSKTVIKKCQSFFSDKSVIGAIITDIQSLKNRFQEIEFTFIPKE